MKTFSNNILYMILGIVLGTVFEPKFVPPAVMICIGLLIAAFALYKILLVTYVRNGDQKAFEKNLLELVCPTVAILGCSIGYYKYLDMIYSSAWIGECPALLTVIIVGLPLILLIVALDFLHSIFERAIKAW